MKRSLLALLMATVLLSACGAGGSSTGNAGSGTVEQGMIDAITGYAQVTYQNDQANRPKYMCQADLDEFKKQAEAAGLTGDKPGVSFTFDLSGIKWSIKQRNAAGDVVLLNIDSGKPKATDKSGQVLDTLSIPGSGNGVKLKNENGWKVCYTASL